MRTGHLPGLSFGDLRAVQNGNDLLLSIGSTGEGMTLKDYYTIPQGWTVQDNTGAQQDVADVLDASNQDEYSALHDDFFTSTKSSIVNSYLSQGYQLQSDGSLENSPIGDSVTKYTVRGTSVNTTDRIKGLDTNDRMLGAANDAGYGNSLGRKTA